jgi:hypothetical protein
MDFRHLLIADTLHCSMCEWDNDAKGHVSPFASHTAYASLRTDVSLASLDYVVTVASLPY